MNAQGGEIEDIEIEVLLQGIRSRYGYDFSHYSHTSLKRRLYHVLPREKMSRFTELLDRLFHDEYAFDKFLTAISITVTQLFRDPPFYKAIRETVVPVLMTFPFVKIWHAGCAIGEEVYSMAILLYEENFLGRARPPIPIIFVTAISEEEKYAAHAGTLGAVDYVFKPVNAEILKSKVKVYLDLYIQKEQIMELNKGLQQSNEELERFAYILFARYACAVPHDE